MSFLSLLVCKTQINEPLLVCLKRKKIKNYRHESARISKRIFKKPICKSRDKIFKTETHRHKRKHYHRQHPMWDRICLLQTRNGASWALKRREDAGQDKGLRQASRKSRMSWVIRLRGYGVTQSGKHSDPTWQNGRSKVTLVTTVSGPMTRLSG